MGEIYIFGDVKKLLTLLVLVFCLNGRAQCTNPPTLNVAGATVDSSTCGQNNGGITGITVTGGTPSYNFQWYYGSGTSISGETNLSLNNVGAGTYSLQVTDAMGCKAVATFSVPGSASVFDSFITNTSTGSIPLTVYFTNQSIGANSYYWRFGDGHTSTAVNPSNTYTAIGTYTVCLIASNSSCADEACEIISAHIAGIEQYNINNNMSIYPNPAKDVINIVLSHFDTSTSSMGNAQDGKGTLVLTDMMGNTVKQLSVSSQQLTLDVSDLTEGVYNISISSNAGVLNKRVVAVR